MRREQVLFSFFFAFRQEHVVRSVLLFAFFSLFVSRERLVLLHTLCKMPFQNRRDLGSTFFLECGSDGQHV